jgi:ComF family protein
MRPLAGVFCSICGEALTSPLFAGADPPVCGLCQQARPPFARAVAYGSYDGGLKDLIHLLKFEQVRPAAGVLGRMLAEAITALEPSLPEGGVLVVPVPLHARKRAQRGFNQAELIARAALKQLGKPARLELCENVLVRRRETGSQIGLTRHQRRENLRGAFAVTDPTRIAGRNVVLVDDVFTTGTTVSECVRVLQRADAAGVWVITVARTLKTSQRLSVEEDSQQTAEDQKRGLVTAG